MKQKKTTMHKFSRKEKTMLITLVCVLTACLLVFGFFVINVRGQMQGYALRSLEDTANQVSLQIDSSLNNLTKIIYTNTTDSNLWKQLNRVNLSTMDQWDLYQYINSFCSTLTAMDDYITLVTLYVDNPSLAVDKTYIRLFDEFKNLKKYEEASQANGMAIMCKMQEVFPDSYYTFNVHSSKNGFCILRKSNYRGVDFGVVIEFSEQLFTSRLEVLSNQTVYLTNNYGETMLSCSEGVFTKGDKNALKALPAQVQRVEKPLSFGWKMTVVPEMGELMQGVNGTMKSMIVSIVAILLVLFLVILRILRQTTDKIYRLGDAISQAMTNYGPVDSQEPLPAGDEIDQVKYSFSRLQQRIDYLMNEVMKKEIDKQNAKLSLLYSQIKPHFLYNTLSCVASLAKKYHDDQLDSMIVSLSDMYRISLNQGRENIPLADEIRLTKSYLCILQNRFDDTLIVTLSADPEINRAIVPKVILQPFIENAVNHALVQDKPLHVDIVTKRQGEAIVLTVQDDGVGIPQETIQAIFDETDQNIGFGVRNVHHRIRLLYGDQYGVSLERLETGGTKATLLLPYVVEHS